MRKLLLIATILLYATIAYSGGFGRNYSGGYWTNGGYNPCPANASCVINSPFTFLGSLGTGFSYGTTAIVSNGGASSYGGFITGQTLTIPTFIMGNTNPTINYSMGFFANPMTTQTYGTPALIYNFLDPAMAYQTFGNWYAYPLPGWNNTFNYSGYNIANMNGHFVMDDPSNKLQLPGYGGIRNFYISPQYNGIGGTPFSYDFRYGGVLNIISQFDQVPYYEQYIDPFNVLMQAGSAMTIASSGNMIITTTTNSSSLYLLNHSPLLCPLYSCSYDAGLVITHQASSNSYGPLIVGNELPTANDYIAQISGIPSSSVQTNLLSKASGLGPAITNILAYGDADAYGIINLFPDMVNTTNVVNLLDEGTKTGNGLINMWSGGAYITISSGDHAPNGGITISTTSTSLPIGIYPNGQAVSTIGIYDNNDGSYHAIHTIDYGQQQLTNGCATVSLRYPFLTNHYSCSFSYLTFNTAIGIPTFTYTTNAFTVCSRSSAGAINTNDANTFTGICSGY